MEAKFEWKEREYLPNEDGLVQIGVDVFVNGVRMGFVQYKKESREVNFLAVAGHQTGGMQTQVGGLPVTLSWGDQNVSFDEVKKGMEAKYAAAVKELENMNNLHILPNIKFSPQFDKDWKPTPNEVSVPGMMFHGMIKQTAEIPTPSKAVN